ncbi:hypothetical protein HETIRDRAFT_457760 [Heterobasidion irregulare TC 32-1]|uniref:Uncharacterized protein n=1 Tax=Heterobasidion irregulare (strain TC 32-1) TaxID=747525 RepID=W4KDZ2_HETIT|nr:uncharacterized protein HETIRDRAFT_457760 [Heterobasidion irregulare TC 32-1]ETW83535.1 hypothetical protein HETIRDRAFT_457760 [Heterobasidion irregulare TC 32-1]
MPPAACRDTRPECPPIFASCGSTAICQMGWGHGAATHGPDGNAAGAIEAASCRSANRSLLWPLAPATQPRATQPRALALSSPRIPFLRNSAPRTDPHSPPCAGRPLLVFPVLISIVGFIMIPSHAVSPRTTPPVPYLTLHSIYVPSHPQAPNPSSGLILNKQCHFQSPCAITPSTLLPGPAISVITPCDPQVRFSHLNSHARKKKIIRRLVSFMSTNYFNPPRSDPQNRGSNRRIKGQKKDRT